jgi:hypothetical protein
VIAENTVRALVFEAGKLNQFFRDEAEVAGLIYQLLGRELAYMKVSNRLLSREKIRNRGRKQAVWKSTSGVVSAKIP